MNNDNEALWTAATIKAALDTAATNQQSCDIEGEHPSGTKIRGRGTTASAGAVRALASSGQVTAIAGACRPDSQAKLEELYQITQRIADSMENVETRDLDGEDNAQPLIYNGTTGIHCAWLFARDMTTGGLITCKKRLEEALRCPHAQAPGPLPYWEDDDSDIRIIGQGPEGE